MKRANKESSTAPKKTKQHFIAKSVKWLIRIVVLLVVIVAAVGYWAYNYFDWKGKVRHLVHQYGTEAVGTSVDIGGIDISLKNGHGSVSEITVANPKDYSQKYIIKLDNVTVNVNKDSIKKIASETVKKNGPKTKTVVIDQIVIDKPEVTYELLNLKQNNADDVLANIKKNTASTPSKPKSEKDENATQYNVAIKKVIIRNGVATVAASMLGVSQSLSVNLPTVTINNLGSEKQGISIENGLARIFQEILKTTTTAVAKVDLKGMLGGVGNLGKAGLDTAGKAAGAAVDTAGKAAGAAGDGVKSLTDSVGGLFK